MEDEYSFEGEALKHDYAETASENNMVFVVNVNL